MEEKTHSDTKSKSGRLPPVVKIILIVFIVLFVLGIILSFVVGKIVKKAGTAILDKALEQNTGMKTTIDDLEKGKMTFTDPETGAKVEINSGKIPDDFPKSFPLYPGAKLTSTMSGNSNDNENGFWLTFSTTDNVSKVREFFKSKLASGGWKTKMALETEANTTFTVSGNNLEGTVSITKNPDSSESFIVIILGEN